MGLSGRQGRRLLVVELLPSVAVAVLAGGVVGVLLPSVLRPALGLDAFTGGATASVVLDPLLVGGSLALVVVALATAVLVETVANRRLRLGAALRLGEES
jgi:putative ABC transport system permease protein